MRTREFKSLSAPTTSPKPAPRSPGDEIFVTYPQLPCHGVKYARVHLRRLISRGLFPRPIMLSPNRIAWKLSDIEAWKATRPQAPMPKVA